MFFQPWALHAQHCWLCPISLPVILHLSFVHANLETLWRPRVIDLSRSLFKSQDELSLDLQIHLLPLLESSIPMPNSANLHHAWLTASPVSPSVHTCANSGWRIKLACSKTVVFKILFCKKGCGNVSVHIRKPQEMFLSAVRCNTNVFLGYLQDTVCRTGVFISLLHILASLCFGIASCIAFLHA